VYTKQTKGATRKRGLRISGNRAKEETEKSRKEKIKMKQMVVIYRIVDGVESITITCNKCE